MGKHSEGTPPEDAETTLDPIDQTPPAQTPDDPEHADELDPDSIVNEKGD